MDLSELEELDNKIIQNNKAVAERDGNVETTLSGFHRWNEEIPFKLLVAIRNPVVFHLAPYTQQATFEQAYGMSPCQMVNLIDDGCIRPEPFRLADFAGLTMYDEILRRTNITIDARSKLFVSQSFGDRFLESLSDKDKKELGQKKFTILKSWEDYTIYPVAQVPIEDIGKATVNHYLRSCAAGYREVADVFYDYTFKRKLMDPKVTYRLWAFLETVHAPRFCFEHMTYQGYEEFVQWCKAVGIWKKAEQGLSERVEVFATDLAVSLLDFGYFSENDMLYFNPSMNWDEYSRLVKEVPACIKRIYDSRIDLIRKEKFGECIEDVVIHNKRYNDELKEILKSYDKGYTRLKNAGDIGIKFAVGSSASMILSNSGLIAQIVAFLAPFIAKYTGLNTAILNPFIKHAMGFGPTETAKLRLIKMYNIMIKKPWARAYSEIERRDLPKDLRIAIRDFWILKKTKQP